MENKKPEDLDVPKKMSSNANAFSIESIMRPEVTLNKYSEQPNGKLKIIITM